MTTAWIDVSAGVAGDMLLGALIDAGASLPALNQAVDAVAAGSVVVTTEDVQRGGLRACRARVTQAAAASEHHRDWATIRRMIQQAALHERTRTLALDTFGRLAAAEAHVHGVDVETVHFHEVGGLDAIADVVGVCEAVRLLGITTITASPLALGAGRIRAAHGSLPVPAPAVLELTRGWQVYGQPAPLAHGSHDHPHPHDAHGAHPHDGSAGHHAGHHEEGPAEVLTPGAVGELATPTGVALLRALAQRCEPSPRLTPAVIGLGAGGRDLPGWANCVRVVLDAPAASGHDERAPLVELRANIDDFDARLVPGVIDACLAAGAADAWVTPIQMKKGRPALMLQALATPEARGAVVEVILGGTSTLGVRESPVERHVLDRSFERLDLDGRELIVKVGHRAGRVLHAAAEYASLADLARASGRTEFDVAQRAQAAIVAAGLAAGSPYPRSAS